MRQRLATGIAQGGNVGKIGPIENLGVQPGDLISVLVGPRDGNHSCDLTAVDLTNRLQMDAEHYNAWRVEEKQAHEALASGHGARS